MKDTLDLVHQRIRNAFSSDKQSKINAWVGTKLSQGFVAGNKNTADFNNQSKTFVVGVDVLNSDYFIFGTFAGYGDSKINIPNRKSSANLKNYSLGAYVNGMEKKTSLFLSEPYTTKKKYPHNVLSLSCHLRQRPQLQIILPMC